MSSNLPRVIALCGARRTGKDTVANYIVDHFGYEHIKITAPLKSICKTLFHFSDDQLETDSKEHVDERWDVSPRQVMQFLGTEVFQYKIQELIPNVGRNFWINSLITQIQSNPDKKYVISDLRFIHEFKELKENIDNVFTVKLVSNRVEGNQTDKHASECEYKNIQEDVLLINNNTKEVLYKKINNIMSCFISINIIK